MSGCPTAFVRAVTLSMTMLSQPVVAADDPIASVWHLIDEGRDLSAVERSHDLGFHPDGTIANEAAAQTWAQLYPRLNGLIAPIRSRPAASGLPATVKDLAAIAAANRKDALSTIVSLARDRRVVILNEAHDAPQDRAFGLAMARALRPLGFSVLAIETFNNDTDPASTDMAALAARGYPIRQNTGTYTSDPVFGDFIRQALALGYRPLAYEQTASQGMGSVNDIDVREEAQAMNLAAAIMRSPDAKFLVYVGYSHAAETPIREEEGQRWHLWMAGRLKRKTGLGPLTIDQTEFGSTTGSREAQMLRDVAQPGLTSPAVLFAGDKPLRFGRYRDAVDLQVVQPLTRIVHGRPNWLESLGRLPIRPPANVIPSHGRVLVQAFLANEPENAVPIDQVVLEPRAIRWLMLPDRPTRLVVKERLR